MINQITGLPFPSGVRLMIFNKLDGISLGKCQRVCKQFQNDIGTCQDLWRNNFAYEQKGHIPVLSSIKDWRAYYIQQRRVIANLATNNFGRPVKFEGCSNNVEEGLTFGDKLYAMGEDKCSICCYSLSTGELLKTFTDIPGSAFPGERSNSLPLMVNFVRGGVYGFKLNSIDSNHFIFRASTQISIWDVSQDICVFALDNVMDLRVLHADGTRVMFYTKDGHLQVWDFKSKQLIKQIDGVPSGKVSPTNSLKINYHSMLIGNVFFVLMRNGQVHAYDIEKGEQIYTMGSGNDRPFTKLLATDKYLVAINESQTQGFISPPIDEENQAYVYEATSGKLIHTIQLSRPSGPDRGFVAESGLSAEISQNQLISVPRNKPGTVTCWDLNTGKIVKEFTPPSGELYFFKMGAPDRLVTTTTIPLVENIGIIIWDLNEGTCLSEMRYRGCSNYLLDGTHVKIHNQLMYFGKWPNDKFHFWDLISAKEIGTFSYDTGYQHDGIWHFDGARFIVSGTKEGVEIYDLTQVPQATVLARIGKGIKSIFGKNWL